MTTITGGPLSSGSYYFKIDATGKIYKKSLWDANPSPFPSVEMTSKFSGNYDDNSYTLNPMDDAGFNVSFLGTMYYGIFVSGNGAVAFGTQNNGSADVNGATASNIPCLLMNANDGNLQHIYTTWAGSPGNRILVYKIQGNTNYDIEEINYDYDIYFYEATGYVDVVVNLEPTRLSAYTDSLFPPKWGVTNGYNWVDGLFHHNKSIGSVGLRLTGQTKTTPTAHQNVSGTSDTIGFFPYAWPEYDMVKPGWSVVQIPGSKVVSVDGTYHVITITGGNFTSGSGYTFTGKTGLTIKE